MAGFCVRSRPRSIHPKDYLFNFQIFNKFVEKKLQIELKKYLSTKFGFINMNEKHSIHNS